MSQALSSVPILSYMALEVSDDVAFGLLLVFVAIYVYRGGVSKKALFLLPLAWFVSLVPFSFIAASPQRVAFECLLPLTLMAGYGFSTVIPKTGVQRAKSRRRQSYGWRAARAPIVPTILLIPLVANSWGQYIVTNSTSDTGLSVQTQQNVYTAMYWLKDNTPSNATYFSVTDWEFIYTSTFFGRATTFSYFPSAAQAVLAARVSRAQYVIVTFYATVQLPPNPKLIPWNTFKQSANMSLVYSNDDVKIFKIV